MSNCNIIKTHRFSIKSYLWLKSKTYLKKVPVMKNNTVTQTIGFVNINSFRQINLIIIITFIIYTNNHLEELAVNICCLHEKQI